MARRLRIDLPNGVYYVTSRALAGRAIALDETDGRRWLDQLDAVATRRRWRVFAWVLMGSHYHLLLETPDGDLSAGMHDLNSGYATALNHRHGRRGPLLQGRFKAILVEPGYRYWDLTRHIHLNPVRLRLVPRPQDYPFSSCLAYLGTHHAPAWLAWQDALLGADWVAQAPPPVADTVGGAGACPEPCRRVPRVSSSLGSRGTEPPPTGHSREPALRPPKGRLCHTAGPVDDGGRRFASVEEARAAYEQFLAEGVAKPPISPLWAATEGVVLGSPQFVARVQEWLGRGRPAHRAKRRTVGVEAIEKAVCTVFGVTEAQLRQRRCRGNEARSVALYLCRKWAEMPIVELGERFGVSHQAVSKKALDVARQLADDQGLAERVGRCEAELGLK